MMVRGRHVYSSCIIHEFMKAKQRGSENDSCSQERYFKTSIIPPHPTQYTRYIQRVQCYHHHLQSIQDAAVSFPHEVSGQAFTSKTKAH